MAIYADPKPRKPIKDRPFLTWKSTLPCYVCGKVDESPAHHLRRYGWGCTGRKPDDYKTVPLCFKHHDMVHNDPEAFRKLVNPARMLREMFNDIAGHADWQGKDMEQFWRRMVEAASDFMGESEKNARKF